MNQEEEEEEAAASGAGELLGWEGQCGRWWCGRVERERDCQLVVFGFGV